MTAARTAPISEREADLRDEYRVFDWREPVEDDPSLDDPCPMCGDEVGERELEKHGSLCRLCAPRGGS